MRKIFRSDFLYRYVVAGNPEEAGPNRKYSLDALPQEIPGSGVSDFRDDMIEIPPRG